MSHTVPTGPAGRGAAMLTAASWPALCQLRNHLINRLGQDLVSAQLLPAVVAEIDRRPEGQALRRKRQFAVLEGADQVKRRHDNCRWRVVERSRPGNQPTWSSPLNLPVDYAWTAFQGLASRPCYRGATAHRQLTLHPDQEA